MRIQKYIYQYGTALGLFALVACSSEQFQEIDLTPGNTPIQLSGVATRATGANSSLDAYKNSALKLTSRINKNVSGSGNAEYVNYFTNVGLIIETTAGSDKSDLNAENAYYPLSDIPLYLYGHTGDLDIKDNKISLKSGKATTEAPLAYDYLVSNGTNGMGTIGSSGIGGSTNSYATLMTFRHVMTKLEVAIDVTDTDLQETKPKDIKVQFKNNFINKEGKYLITTATGDADQATDLSTENGINNYELSVGTHYLVANGKTLSGDGKNLLSSLKIDDYTATDEDLEAITIPKATPEGSTTPTNDLVLKPGLAYKLTFVIERLRVVEVNLTMKPWDIETGDGSWGCDPYKVKMDFSQGSYNNTGSNAISKMVFHYTPQPSSNSYQYIASVKDGIAEFLTLPTDMDKGILTADLYTANGLLIQDHTITYTAGAGSDPQKFNLSLGSNGMVKDKDGYYEVGTPLQFYNMMANPGTDAEAAANKQYKLIKNIDISHLPLSFTPPTFPTGAILDGDGHSILHLELKGNGLFAENKGTLRNLQLSFSSIEATTGTYAGSICAVNNGKIEGCINEADVITTDSQIAGGICGQNKGTILACLNTGNVPNGVEIGGICGENKNTSADAIKACINAGMLHGSSNHGITSNIGGICGYQSETSSNAVINTCYWLTGTARPVQGNSQEMAIGRFANGTADGSKAAYCNNTTNMIENKLRTEGKDNLNNGLGTSSNWEFKWETNSNGTYKTVWPTPIKKVNP
ncbi:hypothetical protein [Bacteroides sp.]|uniref:fimbrillin family protein n=1 Tax=Bacteroides sp. TaxID=29523 RepID=UPI00261CA59A|nr:hypothetical protein [Bacteroides sp.]